jgi:hypothetical protein
MPWNWLIDDIGLPALWLAEGARLTKPDLGRGSADRRGARGALGDPLRSDIIVEPELFGCVLAEHIQNIDMPHLGWSILSIM